MPSDLGRRLAALSCLATLSVAASNSFQLPWVIATAVAALVVGLSSSDWITVSEPRPLHWTGWAQVASHLVPGWVLLMLGAAGNLDYLPHKAALGLWIAGAAWALVGAWRLSRLYSPPDAEAGSRWPMIVVGAAVVAFAAFLRLWNLDTVPLNVDIDEGVMQLVARAVYRDPILLKFAPHLLEAGVTPPDAVFAPFFSGGYTMMRLYYFVLGAGCEIFGFNLFGARVSDAIVGIVSVALLFDGLRRVSSPALATVAAVLLAAGHAHIAYSRVATGNIQTALAVALPFSLLCRLWAAPTYVNAVAMGIALALVVQLYQSSVIVPGLLAAAVVLVLLKPVRWRTVFVAIAITVVTAVSAAMPFAAAAWKWSEGLLSRTNSMARTSPESLAALGREVYGTDRPEVALAYQVLNAVTVFQNGSDISTPYGVHAPMADRYTAALMIPGFVVALLTLRNVVSAGALVFTFGYLLTGLALVYPIGYQRATGALPAAAAIAALGLVQCADVLWKGSSPLLRIGRFLTLAVFTSLCVAASLHVYFVEYDLAFARTTTDVEAGWAARRYGSDYRVHFLSCLRRITDLGQPMPSCEYLDILAGDVGFRPLEGDPIGYVKTTPATGADLFILWPGQTDLLAALLERFPQARVERWRAEMSEEGRLYLVFVGEPRSTAAATQPSS